MFKNWLKQLIDYRIYGEEFSFSWHTWGMCLMCLFIFVLTVLHCLIRQCKQFEDILLDFRTFSFFFSFFFLLMPAVNWQWSRLLVVRSLRMEGFHHNIINEFQFSLLFSLFCVFLQENILVWSFLTTCPSHYPTSYASSCSTLAPYNMQTNQRLLLARVRGRGPSSVPSSWHSSMRFKRCVTPVNVSPSSWRNCGVTTGGWHLTLAP